MFAHLKGSFNLHFNEKNYPFKHQQLNDTLSTFASFSFSLIAFADFHKIYSNLCYMHKSSALFFFMKAKQKPSFSNHSKWDENKSHN